MCSLRSSSSTVAQRSRAKFVAWLGCGVRFSGGATLNSVVDSVAQIKPQWHILVSSATTDWIRFFCVSRTAGVAAEIGIGMFNWVEVFLLDSRKIDFNKFESLRWESKNLDNEWNEDGSVWELTAVDWQPLACLTVLRSYLQIIELAEIDAIAAMWSTLNMIYEQQMYWFCLRFHLWNVI